MVISHPRLPLRVVARPVIGTSTQAPPILDASSSIIDFTCGKCGTVLMRANQGQVRGVVIECLNCRAFNATDV
jgi:predicted RNA-binding Zn-ribbon protein involved in translation (DUF1610 family)